MTRTYRAIIKRPSGRPVGAAEALRKQMSRDYASGLLTPCEGCGGLFPPTLLDVDHTEPLFKGGEDVAENCKVLCRHTCHALKSLEDLGYGAPVAV